MSQTPKISASKSTTSKEEAQTPWDQYLKWLAPLSVGILLASSAFIWWQGRTEDVRVAVSEAFIDASYDTTERSNAERADQLLEVANLFPGEPEAPIALIQAGALRFNEGDYEGALEVVDLFSERYPTHPLKDNPTWLRLHCKEVLGDLDEALEGYQSFTQDDLVYPQAQLAIARIHEQQSDWETAVAVYEEVKTTFPGSIWENQADIFLQHATLQLKPAVSVPMPEVEEAPAEENVEEAVEETAEDTAAESE